MVWKSQANDLRPTVVVQSCPTLFVTPWTVACQDPLSMGFSRQEYGSGVPFPLLGDLPHPGIKLVSPALAGGFFIPESPGKLWGPHRGDERWERFIEEVDPIGYCGWDQHPSAAWLEREEPFGGGGSSVEEERFVMAGQRGKLLCSVRCGFYSCHAGWPFIPEARRWLML